MKSMVVGGIILIIALLAGTYFVAGDAFKTDDYINMLTMLGAAAVITITVFVTLKYVNQIKNDTASGELAEENWDGIGEYKNPIPTGWGLLFIGTIVWMFWYFTMGYPITSFSQVGQYNEEVLEYNKKFEAKWANPSKENLEKMGKSIFFVQCAPCHGVDAEGSDGKAQNLTDPMYKDYPAEALVYQIMYGKKGTIGQMPAFNGRLNEVQLKAVATYVNKVARDAAQGE